MQTNKPDSSAFITVEHAAALLQYSQATIRRWIREGKIKGYRIGNFNHFRVRRGDIMQMFNEDSP